MDSFCKFWSVTCFKIITSRQSCSYVLKNDFSNTIYTISLEILPNLYQVRLFNVRSFSFSTSLALIGMHFSVFWSHRYQTLPFFLLAPWVTRYSKIFNFFFFTPWSILLFRLFSVLFLFLRHLFFEPCLHRSMRLRSTATLLLHFSTSFKAKSDTHVSPMGSKPCCISHGGCENH